ncbi:hypothetical protein L1987_07646 [Smallanthus sonchifolius]|uniref:Uncharacterized protein n=1 Tax=Smallanthus sonchifolius TaxID=185202 RepID=A0ACB9K0U7_9ASTR|nr:hypothetical protein L1987_07646 [Smallanthus sonchifolius]
MNEGYIQALKQQLKLHVERAQDADLGLQKVALESMSSNVEEGGKSQNLYDFRFLGYGYYDLEINLITHLFCFKIKPLIIEVPIKWSGRSLLISLQVPLDDLDSQRPKDPQKQFVKLEHLKRLSLGVNFFAGESARHLGNTGCSFGV